MACPTPRDAGTRTCLTLLADAAVPLRRMYLAGHDTKGRQGDHYVAKHLPTFAAEIAKLTV